MMENCSLVQCKTLSSPHVLCWYYEGPTLPALDYMIPPGGPPHLHTTLPGLLSSVRASSGRRAAHTTFSSYSSHYYNSRHALRFRPPSWCVNTGDTCPRPVEFLAHHTVPVRATHTPTRSLEHRCWARNYTSRHLLRVICLGYVTQFLHMDGRGGSHVTVPKKARHA